MAKISIDLHLHSKESDGELTPTEIVANLVKNKIDFAALTDHDTASGSQEFATAAELYGIRTISGTEITAKQNNVGIHILGYGIHVNDKRLAKLFARQTIERKKLFKKYVMLFKKSGFKINQKKYQEYIKVKSVAKTHVFKLIWEVPENQELCLKKYGFKKTGGIQHTFIDYFMTVPGQIAYAKKKYISAKYAIDLIHKTGGIAIWAHPGLEIEFKNPQIFPKVFKNLLKLGIDGLEAFSTAQSHTKKWSTYLYKLAKKHNLIATVGSDDHDGTRIGRLKISAKYQKEVVKIFIAKIRAAK